MICIIRLLFWAIISDWLQRITEISFEFIHCKYIFLWKLKVYLFIETTIYCYKYFVFDLQQCFFLLFTNNILQTFGRIYYNSLYKIYCELWIKIGVCIFSTLLLNCVRVYLLVIYFCYSSRGFWSFQALRIGMMFACTQIVAISFRLIIFVNVFVDSSNHVLKLRVVFARNIEWYKTRGPMQESCTYEASHWYLLATVNLFFENFFYFV